VKRKIEARKRTRHNPAETREGAKRVGGYAKTKKKSLQLELF